MKTSMWHRGATILIKLTLLSAILFSAQHRSTAQQQAQAPDDRKTPAAVVRGFMDLRFGMFMHWGPISLRGTEIGWSRNREVPDWDYDSLYKEFDPVLFNADDIIRTAKDAGMKYFVITAKHHDGFCLWPSALTDYDIASTPYKKDVLRPFADACRKYGVKLCFYYSDLDWHHPDYPIHNPYKMDSINASADMSRYITYMKGQLKELVTTYKPYMLWFDGPWETPWTQQIGYDMYAYLKSLDKNLLINNRLDKEMISVEEKPGVVNIGDFDTPEQRVGIMNMETPWESCITIARQWAWKPNDTVKSIKTCITTLVRSAGGDGNLLFNVGPMPDGRIEKRQQDLLRQMGEWMKRYSESIYGTRGGPYKPNDEFAATRKGNKMFIHLYGDKTKELVLPSPPGVKVTSAHWLKGSKVEVSQAGGNLRITLPDKLPDNNCAVLVLEMDKNVESLPLL